MVKLIIQSKTEKNPKGEMTKVGYINLLQDGYITIDNLENGNYVFSLSVRCESIGKISIGSQSYDISNNWYRASFILENIENSINVKFEKGIYYLYEAKLETGNKPTDWTPAPEDTEASITSVETIATQTADKFNWIVKSGTSETDFTLTDRTATLVSDYINLNGLVTFNGLDGNTQTEIEKAQGIMNNIYTTNTTTIDGGKITTGSITADKINVADLFAQDITATGTISGLTLTGESININANNSIEEPIGKRDYSIIISGDSSNGIQLESKTINQSGPYNNYFARINVGIDGYVYAESSKGFKSDIIWSEMIFENETALSEKYEAIDENHPVIRSYGDGTTTHIIDQMTHVYVGQNNHIAFNTAKGSFGVTAWVSDTKLKKNIIGTEINALDKINQINMVQFDWKRGGHVDLGVSANQLSEIIPDAVFEVEQEENSEFDSLKNVNPSVLISYCIKAIQELSEENKKLKKEV